MPLLPHWKNWNLKIYFRKYPHRLPVGSTLRSDGKFFQVFLKNLRKSVMFFFE